MSEFICRTSDSVYTYNVASSAEAKSASIIFEIEGNLQQSNTLGFYHKVQRGRVRAKATVTVSDSKSRIESLLLPQLTYPDYQVVTFDRNIPGKSTPTGNFNITDIKLIQEFDAGTAQEVQIEMVEILAP